jgi:hypothetical protein
MLRPRLHQTNLPPSVLIRRRNVFHLMRYGKPLTTDGCVQKAEENESARLNPAVEMNALGSGLVPMQVRSLDEESPVGVPAGSFDGVFAGVGIWPLHHASPELD